MQVVSQRANYPIGNFTCIIWRAYVHPPLIELASSAAGDLYFHSLKKGVDSLDISTSRLSFVYLLSLESSIVFMFYRTPLQ